MSGVPVSQNAGMTVSGSLVPQRRSRILRARYTRDYKTTPLQLARAGMRYAARYGRPIERTYPARYNREAVDRGRC